MKKDDVQILFQQLDAYRKPDLNDEREGGVWSVYLQTRDGQTEFVIRRPNGYTLVFAEPD